MSKSVLVVAGELSGDIHAAGVVRGVLEKNPDIHFFGIGGENLHAAGMEIIHDTREMAVLGLVEVIHRYGFFLRVFKEMVKLARERRPDAVLLIDYPGFNLRFAKEMHKLGIKVIYYVCPQVWAWHRSRIPKIAQIVDRLLVIFPFETEVFAGTGLKVDFVGHPLVDVANEVRSEPLKDLPWPTESHVAILPGSRVQEIQRILPPMLGAAAILEKRNSETGFILAASSDEMADQIRRVMAETAKKPQRVELMVGETRQILRQAHAAMVASGTATIEAALMDCPMTIVYKTALLTYLLGRMLVHVDHLGMVNIVAGETLCPEFIQGRATPANIADAMEPLLIETPERAAMIVGLERVRQSLGQGGCAERAAEIVLAELAS